MVCEEVRMLCKLIILSVGRLVFVFGCMDFFYVIICFFLSVVIVVCVDCCDFLVLILWYWIDVVLLKKFVWILVLYVWRLLVGLCRRILCLVLMRFVMFVVLNWWYRLIVFWRVDLVDCFVVFLMKMLVIR